MAVSAQKIAVKTSGHTDIVDITAHVSDALARSGVRDGILTVFVPGSTAGVTTIEYEPGLLKDLPEALEKVAPTGVRYHHDATWGDGNGYAHVRAALMGASFTVPFSNGKMILGTWQQIILADFDNRPRRRELVVQILGE
ncbi:MAG: secondary thiamine-phosphate synthase enzyme YjbQ [bacterium]